MQVFISYKRQDENFARHLYERIQSWGYTPWLDGINIRGDENWDDAIDAGLKSAEVIIGVLTPESIISPNVKNEWAYADSNKKRLAFIWLKDIDEAEMPHRFIRHQRIDFRKDEQAGFVKLKELLDSPIKILVDESNGTRIRHTLSQQTTRTRVTDRNRERMRQKVRNFWVEGVLEKSLYAEARLELGMETKPEAVENPWDTVLHHIDYGDYKLPPETKIKDLFDSMNGEMLILGEPGSGKTTTLLELARDLINLTFEDELQPIPVVFNLSSWNDRWKNLGVWLTDELNSKYQVPKKVASEWIEDGQLILLLDGLDEVKQEQRNMCVDAINTFRREHTIDLVVCSRIADYESLTSKLQLQGAIVLQPLTAEQIDSYLASFRDELAAIRALLQADSTLQEMVQSPLLLSILVLAYRGMPTETLQAIGTVEARRKHLFEAYVERMFDRKGKDDRYTQAHTLHWLSWLARQMVEHKQSLFYIEELQPNWLTHSQHQTYHNGLRFIHVFIIGVYLCITSWLVTNVLALPNAWLAGLLFGCAGVVLGWVIAGDEWRHWTIVVVAALIFGLATILSAGVDTNPSKLLPQLLGATLMFTILIGAYAIILRRINYSRDNIARVETLRFSARAIKPWFALAGFMVGILITFFSSWSEGSPSLATLVVASTSCALLLLFISGLTSGNIDTTTRPNEGIFSSLSNAVRIGSILVIMLTFVCIQLVAPSNSLAQGILVGIVNGISIGYLLSLAFGGFSSIQHVTLRLILYRAVNIPWNYAQFLDYAAERVFLRKVGGGYIFVHRLLMEYFAGLETENVASNPASTANETLRTK